MLTGSASAAGKVLCSDFELHRADAFDTAFIDLYPSSERPRENVLRFKSQWRDGGDATDVLVLRNQSDRTLPCLDVVVSDLVLVMNLEPGQVMNIPVTRQPGGSVSFLAGARGTDGSLASAKASRDVDRSGYPNDAPVTWTVTISDAGLSLSVAAPSPQPRVD